jgi:hypothetical protein
MEEAKLVFSDDHERHRPAEFTEYCSRCAEEEGQAFCSICPSMLTPAEEQDDGCCDTLFCSNCLWSHMEEEHIAIDEEDDNE